MEKTLLGVAVVTGAAASLARQFVAPVVELERVPEEKLVEEVDAAHGEVLWRVLGH